MPTLKKFVIENFRGIQKAEIRIEQKIKSDVITLIGLNESGKTTVLEALSHFSTGDRTIPNLIAGADKTDHMLSLIPIDKRAAFSGNVSISAFFELTPTDLSRYIAHMKRKYGVGIKFPIGPITLEVSKKYLFIDSRFIEDKNTWSGLDFENRTGRQKKFRRYYRSKDSADLWLALVTYIRDELFELVYFPTLIVNMPERIYLEPHKGENPVNIYYRTVITDVLNSIDGGLEVDKHIVQRLKSAKIDENNPNWFSIFFGRPERGLIDSVLSKIQSAIDREILGSWTKVFQQSVASRSIKVDWNIDTEKNDMVYISFRVSDGESTFALHERSLGFRWFFSYLLFTQFRSRSGKRTIFLFDEPAANLHAKAQIELNRSITRILESGNKVIYSTHSPHMINPDWLSGAYIIENAAIDFDKGDDITGYDTKGTDIRITPYGKFVSEYPEKRTYFQPVWEKLLYELPPIVGTGPYLCVEGISDFHLLSYIEGMSECEFNISIVPGVGAGGFSSTLPALYGAGSKFVLLLDDDRKGRAERKRYVDKGLMSIDKVFTLADVSDDFKGKKLEKILSSETISAVKARFNGKSGKDQIAMYLAEIASSKKKEAISDNTFEYGLKILKWATRELC